MGLFGSIANARPAQPAGSGMPRTLVLPGVLRPPSDCRLLVDVMREQGLARRARVLDVFSGTGALAVAAALDGAAEATAVDISRRAVLNARLNAALNRVRVRALRGDLFAPVAGRRFDLILANPPYIPSASDELPIRGSSRAWDAGLDGRALLDRLCREAHEHLTDGGTLLMVHSSLAGERASLEQLSDTLRARVLARRAGPLGPIARARAASLEKRGVLRPGERTEELLVIAGSRRSGYPAPAER